VETQRVLTPSSDAWRHAGRVLARLAEEHGVDVRRSSIHHDVIIAASTRENDFTIVTNNRADFELMSPYLRRLSFALRILDGGLERGGHASGFASFAEPALERGEGLRMTPGGRRPGALLVTGGIALAGSLISDA
jgi:hypothetical protein